MKKKHKVPYYCDQPGLPNDHFQMVVSIGCFQVVYHGKWLFHPTSILILNWLFGVAGLKQLVGSTGFLPAIFVGKFVARKLGNRPAGGTNPEAKAKERRSLGKGSCLWCLSYRSSGFEMGVEAQETFFA